MNQNPNPQISKEQPIFILVNSRIQQFVSQYYNILDKNRGAITQVYSDFGKLTYNGNQIQDKSSFFLNLPGTEHKVHCIDAHPIFVDPKDPTNVHFFANIYGHVTYAGDLRTTRYFHQTIVLVGKQDMYRIAHDIFRWVGKI